MTTGTVRDPNPGLADRFALWLFPCLEGNGEAWSQPCCIEVDHEAEAGS